MKSLLLLLAVGLVGCSARKISDDPKTKVMQYESHRFADKEQIGDIDVVFPDGTRLKVHNYSGILRWPRANPLVIDGSETITRFHFLADIEEPSLPHLRVDAPYPGREWNWPGLGGRSIGSNRLRFRWNEYRPDRNWKDRLWSPALG